MTKPLTKDFFKPLIEKACELINPSKIILFGSYARGDQKDSSDIDLAFKFSADDKSWSLFKFWAEDEFATLRELDLLNLDEADKSIINALEKEGTVLYKS